MSIVDTTVESPVSASTSNMRGETLPWYGRWWGLVLVAIVSALTCMMWPAIRGERVPSAHDENSYLLAAETFAAGHLTNPMHPMREHFITYHELFEPTYMSKYPPGQGLCLAVGKLLGNAEIGIWIGVALMAVSLTWMLRGWLPAAWATAGGLIAGIAFGGASDWGRTYWGGALAAAGGAMVIGAIKRLTDRPTFGAGAIFGGGVGLLAMTRPFEGGVFAFAVCLVTAVQWAMARKIAGREIWRKRLRGMAGAACVLAAFGSFQLAFNRAVTGSYTKMPYTQYCETYCPLPFFAWESDRAALAFRFEEMNNFYVGERDFFIQAKAQGPVKYGVKIWREFSEFFLKRLGFLPLAGVLLAALWMRRQKEIAGVLAVLLLTVTAQSAVVFYFPHYSAPALGALVLVSMWGFWSLWQALAKRGWKSPTWLPMAMIAVLAIGGPAVMAVVISRFPKMPAPKSLQEVTGDIRERPFVAKLIEQASAGKRAVIFVNYLPGHSRDLEWVYNAADIDASTVVWARTAGDMFDRELMDYYKKLGQERQAWRITIGPTGTTPVIERVEL